MDTMHHTDWAATAARMLQQHSGFTMHPEYGTYDGVGYGVSPYPKRTMQLDPGTPFEELVEEIRYFFANNRDLLEKPGHYIGAWRSSFQPAPIVLDVAVVTDSQAEAKKLQRRFKQKAIHSFGAEV